MKKFLSIALALVMVLSLGAVAFAEEVVDGDQGQTPAQPTEWNGNYTASDAASFKIKKTYTSTSGVAVNETLKFIVTADSSNPGTEKIVVGTNNSVSINSLSTDITVTVPSYSVAGKYAYTIKEEKGNTAGVTYDESTVIKVQVLVQYDNDNHKLVIGNPKDPSDSGITYFIVKENGKKTDTFANTFSCGSFTVAKKVTGNMANETDKFNIDVTLTSDKPLGNSISVGGQSVTLTKGENETVYSYKTTLSLSQKDGQYTFANIPHGVKVSVVEQKNEITSAVTGKTTDNKDVTYTYVSGDVSPIAIESLTSTDIVITNNNSTSVETGVSMDSIPYVVLLTVACLGLVVLLAKKRTARDF